MKTLCKIDKEKSIEHEHSQLTNLPINQQYFEAVKRIKLSNKKQVKGWAMRNKQNIKLIIRFLKGNPSDKKYSKRMTFLKRELRRPGNFSDSNSSNSPT